MIASPLTFIMQTSLLFLLTLLVMAPTSADGYSTNYYYYHHQHVPSSPNSRNTKNRRILVSMEERNRGGGTVSEMEAESNFLREEIKELKKEAYRRLDTLSSTITKTPSTLDTTTKTAIAAATTNTTVVSTQEAEGQENASLLLPPSSPIVFTSTTKEEKLDSSFSSSSSFTATESSTFNEERIKKKSTKGRINSSTGTANLLDGTRWKVSLSIGREPGTWMPRTWGSSGSRINVSFVMDFTSSQLYDRDDFLRGSYAGCKVLHVVNNQATLGPTVTEGAKSFPVKDGGWRVVKGEGPMGTDLLRFYIELEERIAHGSEGRGGGDVDVPKGRVYCSCGYFPFMESSTGAREGFVKELNTIEERIAELRTKRAEITNPFNFDGINLSRDIFRLNQQAEVINGKMMVASVREPDRRLLRFSKDGDVGLTKEGGVCIQVNKGPTIEYHILGRFGIASVDRNSMN